MGDDFSERREVLDYNILLVVPVNKAIRRESISNKQPIESSCAYPGKMESALASLISQHQLFQSLDATDGF